MTTSQVSKLPFSMVAFGLGVATMVASLTCATVTLASGQYASILMWSAGLALVSVVCLFVSFAGTRSPWRFAVLMAMVPLLYVFADIGPRLTSVISGERSIPEAYAAWDTGTLLVEYLKTHDDRWPTSWDDLLSVLESEYGQEIPLRGSRAGDLEYARTLREKVSVDWAFIPADIPNQSPVTRLDGSAFPTVWESGEPNAMVRAYLNERAKQ